MPKLTILRDFICPAELGPVSKTQNSQAREKACEDILAQACRHAPTLLNCEPSYKGVLKKKEKKKKEGEPSESAIQKEGVQLHKGAARKRRKAASQTDGARKKGGRGVNLPKIGYTAEEWLMPLGIDRAFESAFQAIYHPLRTSEPSVEEMSRRNIPRPPIPTKPANPAKSRASSEQQREKKQKTTHDPTPPSPSQAIPVVDPTGSDPKEKALLAKPHIDLTDP